MQDAQIGLETLVYGPIDSEYFGGIVGQSQRLGIALGISPTQIQFRSPTSFIGSDLSNANLTNTDLAEALITNVNFSGAVLTGAEVDAEDLVNLNLCGATLPDGSTSNQGCP